MHQFTVRLAPHRRKIDSDTPRFKKASDVVAYCKELFDAHVEHFWCFLLDQKNRVLGYTEVSVGSIAASLVHPREVFKAAILANAASIIVVHNHPSGDPTMSSEDRSITERLNMVGATIGIPLLDHIVVAEGGESYRSAAEAGILAQARTRT
jgi:DNA repair protein RadC